MALLYGTPTYGSEDDWLRAALDMLAGDGVLESTPPNATSFDADGILDFAGEAIKEYLQSHAVENKQDLQEGKEEPEVLELDYAAHLAQNAAVKAMLAHHTATPSQSQIEFRLRAQGLTRLPPGYQTTKTTTTLRSKNQNGVSGRDNATDAPSTGYKYLGLRISPSPNTRRYYKATNGRRVYSFERQDDPYSGLM